MKHFLLATAVCFLCSLAANAQNVNDSTSATTLTKKERKEAEKLLKKNERLAEKERLKKMSEAATDKDIVYIFGCGTNFNDTTIYITDIQPITHLKLEKKTKFLPYRSEFSLQLKEYLEGTLKLTQEMTCVFFSPSRKTISKRLYKLKKRYLDSGNYKIQIVTSEEFKFKKPDYDNVAL